MSSDFRTVIHLQRGKAVEQILNLLEIIALNGREIDQKIFPCWFFLWGNQWGDKRFKTRESLDHVIHSASVEQMKIALHLHWISCWKDSRWIHRGISLRVVYIRSFQSEQGSAESFHGTFIEILTWCIKIRRMHIECNSEWSSHLFTSPQTTENVHNLPQNSSSIVTLLINTITTNIMVICQLQRFTDGLSIKWKLVSVALDLIEQLMIKYSSNKAIGRICWRVLSKFLFLSNH